MKGSNESDAMKWALAASMAVHALALSARFAMPSQEGESRPAPALLAVLVNAKTKQEPAKAAVMAQHRMDGGGSLEEKGWMPSSPLPRSASSSKTEGEPSPPEAAGKVEALEREIAEMLAAAKASKWSVPERSASSPPSPREGASKMELDLAARIDRQAQAYASRPKKAFVGLQATQSDLAAWVEAWQRKVESIGNAFYPEQAQGKVRGTLILTAGVSRDGKISSIEIDRSSGEKILDDSAKRILKLAGPFEPFNDAMAKKVDILYITRQWRFGPAGLERLESGDVQR